MPWLSEFNAQLERCAQSPEEVRDFIEAFSKVRLRTIARALASPPPPASNLARGPAPDPESLDWSDASKLAASGITPLQIAASEGPSKDWLHIDLATDPVSRATVAAFIDQTCLSDKQRKALFPFLSRS